MAPITLVRGPTIGSGQFHPIPLNEAHRPGRRSRLSRLGHLEISRRCLFDKGDHRACLRLRFRAFGPHYLPSCQETRSVRRGRPTSPSCERHDERRDSGVHYKSVEHPSIGTGKVVQTSCSQPKYVTYSRFFDRRLTPLTRYTRSQAYDEATTNIRSSEACQKRTWLLDVPFSHGND
jgi:hypothetical protein